MWLMKTLLTSRCINQWGAGHSHEEEVQRISIRGRLNDFMQAHGAELAAALAPKLMNYSGQHSAVQRCAMQHSLDYLREAL